MNVLLLMAGLRVWSGGPLEILTRVFLAISLVSLEIQVITWAGAGTFRTLTLPNVAIAAILLWWTSRPRQLAPHVEVDTRHARYLLPATAVLAIVVLFLNNVMRPRVTSSKPAPVPIANDCAPVGALQLSTDSKTNRNAYNAALT